MQPRVTLDGLAMPESPRWHDGRLWFWLGTEGIEDVIEARTGQVLVVEAHAPGVGRP